MPIMFKYVTYTITINTTILEKKKKNREPNRSTLSPFGISLFGFLLKIQ